MIRSLLIFAFIFGIPLNLSADCCGGKVDSGVVQGQRRDNDALREYVNSRRSIPGAEKIDNLTISGDVRTSWAHLTERFHCAQLRGSSAIPFQEPGCSNSTTAFRKPLDAFEITFNMYIDYVYDRAWAVSWISFNNFAGLQGSFPCCDVDPQGCRGSGTCEGICLRKAYLGYNLVTDGCFRLDIEIGRRPLWTVFDSYIQFRNRFDGILLFGSYNVCGSMDAYVKGGPFVIDERVHHFGYVVETGLLNIYDSRFDLKYSIIDWRLNGENRCQIRDSVGSQYCNSQLTAAYWVNSDYLWAKTKLYAAGVMNHAANHDRRVDIFLKNANGSFQLDPLGQRIVDPDFPDGIMLPKGEKYAWYAGFLIGQVCKEGDWSLDVNFQYVQARAIPDCDLSGIGNGGLASCFFLDGNLGNLAPANPFLLNRGNYKGWHFEAIYAFTDNLIIDMIVDFSSAIKQEIIGGKHPYSKFQLQAIFAF